MNETVTACLLVIGNEILSGRTQDKNIQYLAKRLNDIGVRMMEVRVIPDLRETIIATLNEVRAKHDYVFTTGGIGPTHDDITSECVGAAFGRKMFVHPKAVAAFMAYNPKLEMNPARMRMATVPEGSELIDNPVSAAPGFRIDNVFVMAGVPSIMQAMFEGMKHVLRGGQPMKSQAIRVALGEGVIAKGLGEIQDRFPAVEIGSYPSARQGKLGVSLVMRATDPALIVAATNEVRALIRSLGAVPEDELAEDEPAQPAKA